MRIDGRDADVANASEPARRDSILEIVDDVFEEEVVDASARGAPRSVPARSSRLAAEVAGAVPQTRPRPVPLGRLFAASAAVRRDALAVLASRPLHPDAVRAVCRVAVTDPDATLRWTAAEALESAGRAVPVAVIERTMHDGDDRVRAAGARLAARRGAPALGLLADAISEREWPSTQRVALAAVARLVSAAPPSRDVVEALLAAVARLDPPPLGEERAALAAVARAVGIDRLAARLEGPDRARTGAARLLLADGSRDALRVLAEHTGDSVAEIRAAQSAAGQRLALLGAPPRVRDSLAEPTPAAFNVTVAVEPPAADLPPDDDLMTALARGLADPDEAVRGQARRGLARVPSSVLLGWATSLLEDGGEQTLLAAGVAQRLPVPGLALPLLRRASVAAAEDRAACVRALAALPLDPGDLVALLPGVEPLHRPAAVRVLWEVGGHGVLPALAGAFSDTSAAVRMAALAVFEESGDPAVFAVAERLLQQDSSATVRAAAVQALGRAPEQARIDALERALADPDPDVRATAVEVLPGSVSGRTLALLRTALDDAAEQVWRAAIAHLAGVSSEERGALWDALRSVAQTREEALVSALEARGAEQLAALALANIGSVGAEDRVLAVRLAARAGTSACVHAVLASLRDPDAGVRRTAASAMSTLRAAGSVGPLSRSLSDPQPDVRMEAVRALGLIDDDEVPAILIEALKDPEVRVREMATESLGRWGSPAVARRLAQALHSPDLRRQAAAALERVGRAAVDALVDVVTGDDADAAAAAARLLDGISGAATFAEQLSSTDPGERLRAVEVLGAIGGPTAVDGLVERLTDPDVDVRTRAATVLGSLGDLRAVAPLRRVFLSDPVVDVASAAEVALAALGSAPAED